MIVIAMFPNIICAFLSFKNYEIRMCNGSRGTLNFRHFTYISTSSVLHFLYSMRYFPALKDLYVGPEPHIIITFPQFVCRTA